MTEDINKALEVLRKGGIILYPTDTVWGIGCDATNAEAVKKIFDVKKRDAQKPMLVLMDSANRLASYVKEVPEISYDLIELTTKPLTIIYDGAKNLANNLVAADGSIGIRITEESFSKMLCQRFNKPIVSTSANLSGQPTPHSFNQITDEIKNGVDYIVNYRQTEYTPVTRSGIIKLGTNGTVKVIRE
jgi:L-threonylcarbamoyladenylate synthase